MEEDSRFLPDPLTPHSARSCKSQEDIILDNYIEKEYKKIIAANVRKKQHKGWRRFAGLVLTLLSALCTATVLLLVNVLNNYDYDSSSSGSGFDSQNIILWCFGTTLVISTPLLIFCICWRRNNASFRSVCPCPCTERSRQCANWILLMVAGTLCWGAYILRASSIHYLSMHETAAILYCEPLIVVVLAHLCVPGERCGLISILAAILTLGGAVTFTWPHVSGRDEWHKSHLLGIGLGLGSMLCHSILTIALRIIRRVHFSVVLACIALCGFAFTLISFTMHGELRFPTEVKDLLLLSGLGTAAFGALLFFVLALKYEEAAVVSIAMSLEIIFLHLGELAFFGGHKFDKLRIIGGATLLLCTLLVAVRKWVLTRPHESTNRNNGSCCSVIPI